MKKILAFIKRWWAEIAIIILGTLYIASRSDKKRTKLDKKIIKNQNIIIEKAKEIQDIEDRKVIKKNFDGLSSGTLRERIRNRINK